MRQIEVVRHQGYALCDQEMELVLRSIIVPIKNRQDQTVAAIILSVATSRMDIPTISAKYCQRLRRQSGNFQR